MRRSITRILAYLSEPTYAPRIAPAARDRAQGEEGLNAREVDTFALNEPLPEHELDQRVNR